MVHQELNQALKRNVMDNMWLGRFPTVSKFLPFTSEKKMYDETARIFKELEINVDPKTIMSTMPVSQRQMVEIAKAVSYNSKIIVFDEPTSSLTEEEAEHLFRIINMLRDRGCAIIYIAQNGRDTAYQRRGHNNVRRQMGRDEAREQAYHERDNQTHGRTRADEPLSEKG